MFFLTLLNNKSFYYFIYLAATGFLVFYRFKAMNKEETARAKNQWNG
jgi:hypothetical protein